MAEKNKINNTMNKKEASKKKVNKNLTKGQKLSNKERAKLDDMRQIEWYPFDTNND